MLVLSTLALSDPDTAEATAAHEFFHGVQAAAATYSFGEVDFWYWEATATWITSQVFPDNQVWPSLLFGQAFAPEQSINGYFYGQGDLLEYHPYGAFVFVTWLEEALGTDGVRATWLEAPVGGDPIAQIEAQLLEADGLPLADAFFAFAARNAVWDYDAGELFAASIEASGGWEHPWSRRPAGTVKIGENAPTGEGIHTLGAHYWQLERNGTLTFSADAGPSWRAWVAGSKDGTPVYLELRADQPRAVDGVDTWDEAWVVVAAVDGTEDDGVVGAYTLTLTEAGDTGDSGMDSDTGAAADCGCQGGPAPLWLAWLTPLAWLRRRR